MYTDTSVVQRQLSMYNKKRTFQHLSLNLFCHFTISVVEYRYQNYSKYIYIVIKLQ